MRLCPLGARLWRSGVGVNAFEVQFYCAMRDWKTSSAPTFRTVTTPSELSHSKPLLALAAVGHRWTRISPIRPFLEGNLISQFRSQTVTLAAELATSGSHRHIEASPLGVRDSPGIEKHLAPPMTKNEV